VLKIQVLVWSITFALAGCGKGKEGGAESGGAKSGGVDVGGSSKLVASCDQRDLASAPIKNCIEYLGSAWTAKEVLARCGMEGHKFLDGACPTDGVVFSCLQEGGKPMEAVVRYYDKPERAQKSCQDVGGTPK